VAPRVQAPRPAPRPRAADPDHPEALAAAIRWAERETWGLLLTGSVGVGKTHMAVAAA
jgi:DNA replication protein DnaC